MSAIAATGRRGLTALVVSAAESGDLARLPMDRAPVACAVIDIAVPALTLGDLDAHDLAWAERHGQMCPDCRTIVGQSRRLSTRIDGGTAHLDGGESVQISTGRNSPVARATERASVWSMETPVGHLYGAVSDRDVGEVDVAATTDEPAIMARLRSRGFASEMIADDRRDRNAVRIGQQMSDYLTGKRHSLDVPYDLGPVTPFTRQVLEAVATIPFGSDSTYCTIAARIGQPGAGRSRTRWAAPRSHCSSPATAESARI